MALKSGFYNALESGGVYDRTYTADEYTNFYNAFITDGVRRSGDNDFYCSADGLTVSVAAGFAICGSKWIHNDTAYSFPAVTVPVGDYSRIDAVFLRVDTREATRAASLVYRQGTPASTPTAPTKDTTTGVFELCLCHVLAQPSTDFLSITDKRGDSDLCGWITTPVGYDDYFVSLESAFNDFMDDSQTEFNTWFANVRQTLAVSTLFKQYCWYVKTTDTTTTTVTFNIPQYDPTGVDIVQVYTNGMLETANVDYTISGSTITFTNSKIANTEILVIVYKSIDGAGLGSVSDEVTALQNQVDAMQDVYGFNYICNGETDNEGICALARQLKTNVNDNGSVKINIFGTFGAEKCVVDGGILFYFGEITGGGSAVDDWGNIRLILDFTNCNFIRLDTTTLLHVSDQISYCFAHDAAPFEIIGLNLYIEGCSHIFSETMVNLTVRNSRIWNMGNQDEGGATIARSGCFYDSFFLVDGGGCFVINTTLRYIAARLYINNCECYAFENSNKARPYDYDGYCLYSDGVDNGVAIVTNLLSCPNFLKTNRTQHGAIKDFFTSSTRASYCNTLTPLSIDTTNQNVNGTIALPDCHFLVSVYDVFPFY